MKKSKPGSAQTRPLAPAAARPGVKGLGWGQDRLPQQRLLVPRAGRLALLGLWERTGHSPAASWPNPPRLFSSPPPPRCPRPPAVLLPNRSAGRTRSSHRWKDPAAGKGRVRLLNSSPPPPSGAGVCFSLDLISHFSRDKALCSRWG